MEGLKECFKLGIRKIEKLMYYVNIFFDSYLVCIINEIYLFELRICLGFKDYLIYFLLKFSILVRIVRGFLNEFLFYGMV